LEVTFVRCLISSEFLQLYKAKQHR